MMSIVRDWRHLRYQEVDTAFFYCPYIPLQFVSAKAKS